MTTVVEHINSVLGRLRANLGLGETPPGSNNNFIVEWYNANVDKIGRGPWCEMTNTWAMWAGSAKPLKKGRAYTVWAAQDAVNGVNGSSWHYGTVGMKAGDQVYFDWSGPGEKDWRKVDHTGTVERVNGNGTYYILEGNYNDKLQRMLRDDKFIVGYVRFAWNKIASKPIVGKPSPTPVNVVKPPVSDQVRTIQTLLEVKPDGVWGPVTDKAALTMRNAMRSKVGWPRNTSVRFDIRTAQAIVDTPVDGVWGDDSQKRLKIWVRQFRKALGTPAGGRWEPASDNKFLAMRKKFLTK